PDVTAVDRILTVDHMINLDGLVVLLFGCEGREEEARRVQAVANSEVVWQRHRLEHALDTGIQAEALGIGCSDVIRADIHARQYIGGAVDGGACGSARKVTPTFHVSQNALPRLRGIHIPRSNRAGARAETLKLKKEECAVLEDWSTDSAAIDILLKLSL